jgi:hypothetical protein
MKKSEIMLDLPKNIIKNPKILMMEFIELLLKLLDHNIDLFKNPEELT